MLALSYFLMALGLFLLVVFAWRILKTSKKLRVIDQSLTKVIKEQKDAACSQVIIDERIAEGFGWESFAPLVGFLIGAALFVIGTGGLLRTLE